MATKFEIQDGEKRRLDLTGYEGEIEIYQRAHSSLSLFFLHAAPRRSAGKIPVRAPAPARENSASLFLRIFLEQSAALNSLIAFFGGSPCKIALETRLQGESSEVSERTIYLGNGNETFDMTSNAVLSAPNTKTEIFSKGILTGRSQGRFNGNIHIQRTARRSEARLNEHTLLLSPDAEMNAIPCLKIDTNDVIASHSAGMTRVDSDQLFYAESRGVPEEKAVRMIAEGFLLAATEGRPEETFMKKLIQEKICRL